MTRTVRFSLSIVAAAIGFSLAVRADAPYVYAIKGARLVTVSGAAIASGTIVVRNGVIDAVGADVQAPPEAVVIDGAGSTVYPGLIDMGTSAGLDINLVTEQPSSIRTFDDAERWKRDLVLRSDVMAADHLNGDAADLNKLAAAGITTALSTPPGVLFAGHSALVNVVTPADSPIVGAIAEPRKGVAVLKSPVALHVKFQVARGDGYPVSLLGAIAFVRQTFIDADYQHALEARYAKSPASSARPSSDAALEAIYGTLGGRPPSGSHEPVAFEANLAREIVRALDMAKEFKLTPIITGGQEADLTAADLKAAGATVIFNLDYPTRPKSLAPDGDEPVRELRLRAHVPKVPAGLEKAGVQFAFSSSGLTNASDFVKNAARAVKEGLNSDAAVRALTLDAARIAGAADRLGSLEQGKIANIIMTDGDLFAEKTTVKVVLIDGRRVDLDASEAPRGRGRGGR
jgi:imidazolonepropionase-like amidohydrolase